MDSPHHPGPAEGLLCLLENTSVGASLGLQGLLLQQALGNQSLCHTGIVLGPVQEADKVLILLLLFPDGLPTAMDIPFQGLEVTSVIAGGAKRWKIITGIGAEPTNSSFQTRYCSNNCPRRKIFVRVQLL